jgi:hypothetical protein
LDSHHFLRESDSQPDVLCHSGFGYNLMKAVQILCLTNAKPDGADIARHAGAARPAVTVEVAVSCWGTGGERGKALVRAVDALALSLVISQPEGEVAHPLRKAI